MNDLERDLNRSQRRRALCLKVERLPLKVSGIGKHQWGLFYRVLRANAFYAGKVISDIPRDQQLVYWHAAYLNDRADKRYVDWLAVREAASRAGIAPSLCFRGTHGE